ncbi:uncharacterized protein LOC9320166 [Arabidopsis lyrata subsp. lyrata]|nr:uncharacterized protein LOC9320166 [Arabidopsis lyrata subsp. lyrata]|eukprot:XP_020887828.1 uncharacterized protein LOC9320166 [Arabidopsis lyrata subsp. lyrata]
MPSTVGYLNDGGWFSRLASVDLFSPLASSFPAVFGYYSKAGWLMSGIVWLPYVSNFANYCSFPTKSMFDSLIDGDSFIGIEAPAAKVEVGLLSTAHLTRVYVYLQLTTRITG